MKSLAIILVLVSSACAQVIQLAGGTSSMMGGTGGGVTAYFPNSTLYAGAGATEGRLSFGISDTTLWRGLHVIAGDDRFSYSVDGAGLAVISRGIAVSKETPDRMLAGFVGSTGIGSSLPFYQGSTVQHFGFGFFARQQRGRWSFSTLNALDGSKKTASSSASFVSRPLKFSLAGGLLESKPTAYGSFDFAPWQALHFVGAHQDVFYTGTRGTFDSFGSAARAGSFSISAIGLRAQSLGRTTVGYEVSGGGRIGLLGIQSGWYASNGHASLFTSVSENTRHWSLTQNVQRSDGRNTFAAGGGYHGNKFSVTLDHTIQFVPIGPGTGFQNVTSVTVSIRIPHSDASANLSAVSLNRRVLYTAYGNEYAHGPLETKGAVSGPAPQHSMAKHVIRGTVKDTKGAAVEGAAVQIDREVAFTDQGGVFFVRQRREHAVRISVLVDSFTEGSWTVVTAPDSATPEAEVVIVVERKK